MLLIKTFMPGSTKLDKTFEDVNASRIVEAVGKHTGLLPNQLEPLKGAVAALQTVLGARQIEVDTGGRRVKVIRQ